MFSIHTHAAIISIGDELIRGQMLDTNSRDLSALLLNLGIPTIEHITIGDSQEDTAHAIRRAASIAPLVVITGGLGPTQDDLTRESLASVLNEPLIEDTAALATLDARLRARGRVMSEAQRRQAQRPPSALCLANPNGTAPGLFVRLNAPPPAAPGPAHQHTDLFCLPGPPNEWRPMFTEHIAPKLTIAPGRIVRTRLLHLFGLSEAEAASAIPGLMERDRNPLVGITASGGVLTWRICFDGSASVASADLAIAETAALIRSHMADHIFAEDGPGAHTGIAAAVLRELSRAGRTLATVESCTGGMIGQMLTDLPGASATYLGGWVTYANSMKQSQVAVAQATLATSGAVSHQAAMELASGGLERSGADFAIAVTGIAGPDGGTPDKPIGTVWIGLGQRGEAITARRFRIPGTRDDVRRRAATIALALLYFRLVNSPAQSKPTLWEWPDT